MIVKVIVWVCIAGLVIALAGPLAVFILPLMWIGWSFATRYRRERTFAQEEARLNHLILEAQRAGLKEAAADLAELRPLIRRDLAAYSEAMTKRGLWG